MTRRRASETGKTGLVVDIAGDYQLAPDHLDRMRRAAAALRQAISPIEAAEGRAALCDALLSAAFGLMIGDIGAHEALAALDRLRLAVAELALTTHHAAGRA